MCRLIYLHYSLSSGALTSLLSNVKTYYGGGKESSRGHMCKHVCTSSICRLMYLIVTSDLM